VIVRILGSAAGGGVPQWNCACDNCRAAREGSPWVRPRTQCSVAVSARGDVWTLLNASPDVREQVRPLGLPRGRQGHKPPPRPVRGTPIASCVLTDAELDHTLGLLVLREGERFDVIATRPVCRWLARDFPVAPVLGAFCRRRWRPLPLERPVALGCPDGTASGLIVRAFATGARRPRYARGRGRAAGAVVGLVVEDLLSGRRLVYAPGVATPNAALRSAAERADAVLLDGTFWSDDELPRLRLGRHSARALGHWPVGGRDGSLRWLGEQRAPYRAYLHLNNTNPMLAAGSPERRSVERQGIRVAEDGDEFEL
jgi:pyrroloquinoline quinone biosynthesis protein B